MEDTGLHLETLSFHSTILFLIAAGVIVPFLGRLRVSPVSGFIIIGLVIGPYGLARFSGDIPWLAYATIGTTGEVRALAELGIIFLLFLVGLDLSFDRLWAMRRYVFGLGSLQVAITGTIIAAIAFALEYTLVSAWLIGIALAFSSTAVVLDILSENRRLGTKPGRTSFSVLLFQDLAVLPVLFFIGTLENLNNSPVLPALGFATAQAFLTIIAIFLSGRILIRPLFRIVGTTKNRDAFLALVFLVIIGTALLAQAFGLSMALGAFLAGLLLAETEYRYAIEIDISPFKGLLLGLFFVSIGMSIDPLLLTRQIGPVMLTICALFFIKAFVVFWLARLFRLPASVALESAFLLSQSGEFSLLVIGLASGAALIPGDTGNFLMIVIGLMMLATPGVTTAARHIISLSGMGMTDNNEVQAYDMREPGGHFIIIGYGRVGQMIGSLLATQEFFYIAVDNNNPPVSPSQKREENVFYGDARRPEMLHKLGIETAAGLVITMNDFSAAEQIVAVVRKKWPNIKIYSRARDIEHARALIEKGAGSVVPEVIETSLQLGQEILKGAGLPESAARQLINARRLTEQDKLYEKT